LMIFQNVSVNRSAFARVINLKQKKKWHFQEKNDKEGKWLN
jgi:hypothetical protein